jgi:hypothetical protein
VSDLSRKTFSILRLDTFCPLQLITKSEKVRIIKSLFIDVSCLFFYSVSSATLAGNVKAFVFVAEFENRQLGTNADVKYKSSCFFLELNL